MCVVIVIVTCVVVLVPFGWWSYLGLGGVALLHSLQVYRYEEELLAKDIMINVLCELLEENDGRNNLRCFKKDA